MKVVVAGNCQARPLAQLLSKLNPEITITATPIVHLLQPDDEAAFRPALDEADIIITQLIADSYPCEFIRTNRLRERYGDKVKTILNLYFNGYNPDLRYLRHPTVGTLRGPLGEYHNQTIMTGWMLGISQQLVVKWLNDPFYNQQEYALASQASLAELKKREELVDVPIVDCIEAGYQQERFFFTFNHPSAALLARYAQQISLSLLGNQVEVSNELVKKEFLDQLIPKIPPGLGHCTQSQSLSKGQEVLSVNGAKIELGAEKNYTDEELVALFYQIYSENADFIREKYDT